MNDFLKKYIFPIAMLSSSVIGVGFFSLPYIALQSGIWITLTYLIISTAIILLINSIVGDIALKTPDFKRIPGFVGFHLGKWAEAVSLFSAIVGGVLILLVYLIIGGDFLLNGFSSFFSGSYLFYVILYSLLAFVFIYFDIKAINKIQLGVVSLLFLFLIIIFIEGFFSWKLSNLFTTDLVTNMKNIFLPYGPIIFSLWGIGLIPEAEEMLKNDKKDIKKIISISVLLPAIVYFLFIVLVLGITGGQTTQSALIGLKEVLGGGFLTFGLLAGAIITFNAFISLGLILKKVLMYDLGVKKHQSVIIVCSLPLILFLLGFRQFIPIISFIGSIFIGIDGILILMVYKKIGGVKKIIYPLASVFLLGIIYEILYFIK